MSTSEIDFPMKIAVHWKVKSSQVFPLRLLVWRSITNKPNISCSMNCSGLLIHNDLFPTDFHHIINLIVEAITTDCEKTLIQDVSILKCSDGWYPSMMNLCEDLLCYCGRRPNVVF